MQAAARAFTRIVFGTRTSFAWVPAAALLLGSPSSEHDAVPVRHVEGVVHAFLALSTVAGHRIADGSLIQTVDGDRVTAHLTFRFTDGSEHDETTVFTQRGSFRLVSDHLRQTGRRFPPALDLSIDVAAGQVRVSYTDDGRRKAKVEQKDLPADLSNGIIPVVLKNLAPADLPRAISYIAPDATPRLVSLDVKPAGTDRFMVGRTARTATDYVLKADLGGLTGVFAGLLGKTPPDSHVWILRGAAPAFVKSEQPLYVGGPVWRIELTSPAWPADDASR